MPLPIPVRSPRLLLAASLVVAGCGDPSGAPRPTAPAPAGSPAPAAAETLRDGSYPGFRVAAFTAKIRRPSAGGVTEAAFDSRATKSPTLYIVNSAGCPACLEYAERIRAVESRYMAKGVDVVHVYPNRTESADDKIAWHARFAFQGGQILDEGAVVARKLEAERTPTVWLADAQGRIVYRGGIDSSVYGPADARPWLADALDQFLAGRPVEEDTTEPMG